VLDDYERHYDVYRAHQSRDQRPPLHDSDQPINLTAGIKRRSTVAGTAKRHVTAILSKLKLELWLQAGLAALIVASFASVAACWPEGRMDPAFDGR
jgi:hypothetical protein